MQLIRFATCEHAMYCPATHPQLALQICCTRCPLIAILCPCVSWHFILTEDSVSFMLRQWSGSPPLLPQHDRIMPCLLWPSLLHGVTLLLRLVRHLHLNRLLILSLLLGSGFLLSSSLLLRPQLTRSADSLQFESEDGNTSPDVVTSSSKLVA